MNTNQMDDKDDGLPIWMYVNALSLDAVAIGLLWQFIFTIQFCQRYPSLHEFWMIGLSIWLVYTADHLLDSVRLDTSLPHSFRHRFHVDFRKSLSVCWFTALGLNAAIIVYSASDPQLRWGCAAITAVIGYVVGVQLAPKSTFVFPKELQAGMVFAFGVSLTAWSEIGRQEIATLLISTLMAGLLFAGNCLAIAGWERRLDANQKFDSFALRLPKAIAALPIAMICHLAVALLLYQMQFLPPLMVSCLIASDLMLVLLSLAGRNRIEVGVRWSQCVRRSECRKSIDAFVALSDVALVIPPLGWAFVETLA